ncbi:MAG: hypothetical protein IJ483_02495 [Flavobacteriales bacterium]|nr:hypothetical protein [Flavobacteriales bacterium]MBQ8650089.1 hypothetical protein [Flavobacteriales bacterium]
MNKNQYLILKQIHDFVNSNGGNFSAFYIGVTDNPISMLRFHGVKLHRDGDDIVSENTPVGTWCLPNEVEARELKAYMAGRGMSGRLGGTRAVSTYVYCYKITPDTRQ